MKEIILHGSRILAGERAGNLPRHLPGGRVIVITNPVVRALHGHLFPSREVIEIGDGEEYKTLETVDRVAGRLIELGADRETFILGFGGGIACDVAGFVASIFMRGCPFGFVPTTLLAQADASVGGKNGVNYRGYKNMLGTFGQPRLVLCDPSLPLTLPPRDYAAGFAEIVKAAIIANAPLFAYLEGAVDRALQRDEALIEHATLEAIKVKVAIVAADERERGERRLLNLGHTFAHAIEKRAGISHGEAVSVGLCMVSRLAVRLGMMDETARARVEALLARLGLPVTVDIPARELLAVTRADKKRDGDAIHLVLPVAIGRCETRLFTFEALERLCLNDEP
jgi:3-dehydroquinate synthase